MAEIKAATNEKVFQITAFRGLNQNPDGDTKLKLGEAAVMDNFRITRDNNLQRRPGTKTRVDLETHNPIKGLWAGYVHEHEYILGACNGKLYKLWTDQTLEGFTAIEIGSVNTDKDVFIFGFDNDVYIIDGYEYRKWDGSTLAPVHGYRPLVMITLPPENGSGSSATLENINRLNGERRVWLSPDGTGTTFKMPEKDIKTFDYLRYTSNGEDVDPQDYTAIISSGTKELTITFTSETPPPAHPNSFEVGYTVSTDFRTQITNMQYAELFSGVQDTRIFLYGDGTNKTIYSGMDYDGKPRADYFPDLYEALVGDENTPITGMIRHYSSLACFKKDSAWSITASDLSLTDGLKIPSFYVTPINKIIGNAAMGQVRLVLNSPFTLFGNDLYEWKNSSYYTSNLTRDERQAKRISDRVWSSLKNFDTKMCYCFDDNDAQEYYICHSGEALVYNYAADAWSKYSSLPVSCMVSFHGEPYIGSPDGKLKHLSYAHLNDDGVAVESYWESGSMGFGQDYMRKYSASLWVGIKPEGDSEVWTTVKTDKSDTLKEKVVDSSFTSFANAHFNDWTFNTNGKPHMKKLKIKAKKFVFYKLIFKCDSDHRRATVLAADIRVRFTGFAK